MPRPGARDIWYCEVRARRRYDELVAKHGPEGAGAFEAVLEAEKERDRRDTTRATAPLVQAPDAELLDTSELGIDAVVAKMVERVQAAASEAK